MQALDSPDAEQASFGPCPFISHPPTISSAPEQENAVLDVVCCRLSNEISLFTGFLFPLSVA